jgi:hypothetical protein
VQAALGSTGARRGKPNVSRIAVLTGLTRVEVAAILKEPAPPAAITRGRQRAERVLAGWWNDPQFQTPSGKPAILAISGRRRSFAALCRRYSGAVEPARVLEELVRVKAVRRVPGDHVEVLSRTYATVRWSPAGIEAAGAQLAELCATLAHNLRDPSRPLFVRRILNARLKPEYAPLVRRDLEDEASSFIDALDDTLNDPLHTARERADATQLGMAVYLFEGGASPAVSSETGARASRPQRLRRRRQ